MKALYRQMTEHELWGILDWAAVEGWNPGHDDAQAFFLADPAGFFVAIVEDRPVAAISVVNHSDDFAFLGLYLCKKEFRGLGLAYGLWQHALQHAEHRVVGLDGVPDQQENYRKSGFVLSGQTYRYSGVLPGRATDLRPVAKTDFDKIIMLDAAASGYAKPAFLTHWLTDTPTRSSFVMSEPENGFATIRKCRTGHKIGPLVASSVGIAQALILGAIHAADARDVVIDVPDDCPELVSFCESSRLSVSFNTARMYRGVPPRSGSAMRTIATLELG